MSIMMPSRAALDERLLARSSGPPDMPVVNVPTIVNLGCGKRHLADALNVDLVAATRPDVVHDLNHRPWPLPTGHFTEVHLYDVLEHLEDVTATLEEVHRISRHGAVVRVTVPHFSSANAYTDPTHRHGFGFFSLDYYTGENAFGFYSNVAFKYRTRSIVFERSVVNLGVRRLARWRPRQYERRWAWIFPAWFLYFEIEVVK